MQNETGYTNDHIAASFHASHYHRLVGEETPRSKVLTARVLRDQRPDGSWWLNMPARDRHATFDAVFTLEHDGDEGGLGHAPGSTSDADANYFQIGVLVMAGLLPPVDPLPADHELLSWGHLIPIARRRVQAAARAWTLSDWASSVDYHPNGERLAAASAPSRRSERIAASGK